MDHSHTALIIVDNQIGALNSPFWGPARSNPSYLSKVTTLVSSFRSIPPGPLAPHILHIYHASSNPLSPLHPSSPEMGFHSSTLPLPHEPVFSKTKNSAFCGTSELENWLRAHDIWKIYFVGLSVDLCLGSTIRHGSDLRVADHEVYEKELAGKGEEGMKGREGKKVVKGDIVLVEDATAAWAKYEGGYDADLVHGVHVGSLKGEYARVIRTEDVLTEIGVSGLSK